MLVLHVVVEIEAMAEQPRDQANAYPHGKATSERAETRYNLHCLKRAAPVPPHSPGQVFTLQDQTGSA
jgi:hypothetical protein